MSRWEKWERNGFTMSEKRILMTHIFASAWEQFSSAKYHHARVSAFVHSGCAITLSGINDHLIEIENLPSDSIQWKQLEDEWKDDDYAASAWSAHEQFKFADELPGGNDEKGEDSSLSCTSSSSSSDEETSFCSS